MESIKRKDDLELYYKVCLRELERAKTNINTYLRKVDELFLWICDVLDKYSRNSQAYFTVFDAVVTDLSNLAEITRKFNISCESNSFKFNCVSSIEKLKNCEKEQFTYLKQDLLKYGTSYTGHCVITYIKDKDQRLFYISECENPEQQKCATLLKNYFLESPKRFNGLPKEGEIFGVYLEGYLLRAVRENDQYLGNRIDYIYNAYLIDIGEIIKVTSDMEIYVLPYECTQIPAQGILCKLEMVDSNTSNLDKFLNDKIYMKFKFVVLSQDNYVLHVNLVGNNNPFLDYLDNNSACANDIKPVLINPFRQYQCILKKDSIKNNYDKNIFIDNTNNTQLLNTHRTFLNDTATTTNNRNTNFIEQTTPKNIYFSSENCTTNNTKNPAVISGIDSNNYMTALEQNNLNLPQKLYTKINDNNSNTSDLTDNFILRNRKSNQSDVSKQMKRLSLQDYYNDIINNTKTTGEFNLEYSNFNLNQQNNDATKEQVNDSILPSTTTALQGLVELQNNENNQIPLINQNSLYDNNLQQQTLEDDGKNKESKIFRNKNKLIYPKVGEVVTLIPTCIQTTEIFFAHYYNHESRYGPTLGELIRKMNEPEQIKMYTPIKRPLEKFELVLALFKDGFWYRARVVNIYDNFNVKVFYVDYGNADLVTINQIRNWEPRFECLPFQAIQCQISGIKERTFSVTVLENIKKMILDKYLRAKIIKKVDNKVLVVKISDSEGCDIGDQLILMGFARKIEHLNC